MSIARKPIVYLPHDQRREVFCPDCESPGTEWHPAESWGLCHQCGAQWKLYPVARWVEIGAELGKLGQRTQDLIWHIARGHDPKILARVAVLMHRGEPVPFGELDDWHRFTFHRTAAPAGLVVPRGRG